MTDLQTLMAEGLQLQPGLETAPAFMSELLEWRDVRTGLPDDTMLVLAWVKRSDEEDWTMAFMDAGDWREGESGGLVDGVVTHWAQPEGPKL